ncbi:MAG: ATPase P [Bacteroidetes bacterium GWD2_45_23]|jgi:P-type E1-E2 ATPase|nr:MAG: ATPase P [Bacteroidetes bacterium GWC2_46_850]OFX74566.1 MAG: ATPase P [Bacteroidetes bacterium GWC1_47_7]OFX82707.1 MAG: ATPase P [Bacteroidetes bacterium GWD2_45_23]HAR39396.1 ATPase P [Porphyromonadaceae bacterium]HBB02005.1 ATPase P [Porphyromonadaceae bacterium]
MITIETPGIKKLEAEHLVLDYNGTLAIDGKLIPGIRPLLEKLSNQIKIHILTADTFGTSKQELAEINCELEIIHDEMQDVHKEIYVDHLEREKVIAIGNGANDALMLAAAGLGILVIQKEGASVKALMNADIVCNTIVDALELLTNPLRIVATLRK